MNTAKVFSLFLDNIKIDNSSTISNRYHEITKKLNKTFRDTDSETDNCLQVGSYGRYTGIKGISDLDMLYIMPDSKWSDYNSNPDALLSDVRQALHERYPTTTIKKDTLIVDVCFNSFTFEVQPVFEFIDDDGNKSYKYPNTKDNSYKITKPRQEQKAMKDFKNEHGTHHRLLCKMLRSWKNQMGVPIGGLLIDTITYNFLTENEGYDFTTFSDFDTLSRDFFEYLKDQPKDKSYYLALGSNQKVKVKHQFVSKAEKSYKKSVNACSEDDEEASCSIWRDIYGTKFPKKSETTADEQRTKSYSNYRDTEQFIENIYPINIKYSLKIDCEVKRNGFRESFLSILLNNNTPLYTVRSLDFFIKETDVPKPYEVKWKIRNVGKEAERKDCIRGQIVSPNNISNGKHESANFRGPHFVECYIIKEEKVVARDRIEVPIKENY